MAHVYDWNLLQQRSIDPFSDVTSSNVSTLSAAFSENGSGKSINSGLAIELLSPTQIKVTKGVAIKDYVVIHFIEDIYLDLNDMDAAPGDNYVVLEYHYEVIEPPPVAKIRVIPTTDYNPSLHLIIGKLKLNLAGTLIEEITYTDREDNTALTPIQNHSILELCDTPNYNNGTGFCGHGRNLLIVGDSEDKLEFLELSNQNFDLTGNCLVVCALDGYKSCDFLKVNGSNSPSANINFNGFTITNIANPVNDHDPVPLICLKECINEEANIRDTCDTNLEAKINCLCQCIIHLDSNINNNTDSECLGGYPACCYSLVNHTHKFTDLQCVPSDFGNAGQILVTDGTKLTWQDGASFRAASFTGLTDTPSNYATNDLNKVLVVDYQNGNSSNPLGIVFKAINNFISLCDLQDINSSMSPVTNQVLTWTGSYWTACDVSSLSGSSSFIGLIDTPSSFSGANDKLLKVCVDGSGSRIEFIDAGSVIGSSINLSDLADVDTTGALNGQVLTVVDNGGNLIWKPQTVSSGGSSCSYEYFHLLLDTPNSYDGYNDYILRVCDSSTGAASGIYFDHPCNLNKQMSLEDLCDVNTGPMSCSQCDFVLTWNGLAWIAKDWSSCFASSGSSRPGIQYFTELCDTPSSYSSHAPVANLCPYMLVVNNSANGVNFCNFGDVFNILKCTISLNDLQSVCAPLANDPNWAGNVLHYTQNCVICLAPYYIQCLRNVCITNPSEGQALIYHNGYWINSTITAGNSNVSRLEDLNDVTNTTNAPNGYVLTSCNGCWHPAPVNNQGLACVLSGTGNPPVSADVGTLYIQYI